MTVRLNCLGPLTLLVDDARSPLPASHKTRCLLAWLALEPRRHRRERLCELLWELPDDPRAALRWSLSKLRPLLDTPDRLDAGRDDVMLVQDGLSSDVADVRALAAAPDAASTPALIAACRAAAEPFLADGELPAQPYFQSWIISIRQEMLAAQRRMGANLLGRPLAPADRLVVLDALLQTDPLAADLHARRIAALTEAGDASGAAAARALALQLLADVEADPAAALTLATTVTGQLPLDLPNGVLAQVVVMPFTGTGDPPVLAETLAGLVEAGVADSLSRFASLSVQRAITPIARAYAVAGAVLVAGAQTRVRFRLLDDSGFQLWAGDVSAAGADLLALEEAIASQLVAVLEPRIRYAEVARARRAPDGGPDDLFLQALAQMAGEGDFARAMALLEQALAQAPDHGLSGAFLPWAALQCGQIADAAAAARFAALARHAVHCAPDDVMVQAVGGLMLVLLAHDFVGGSAIIDRAVRRQPQSMFGWMARGWANVHGGDNQAALADFDRADALSPADPTDNSINAGRAIACFQAGDLAAAAAWVQQAHARTNASLEAERVGIAIAVEQGDLPAARALARRLLARNPAERARRALLLPFRQQDTATRLHAAFRAAGIPE
ncbi:MAG: hypothetical protein ACOYO0_06020 [Sandarakinorhabdus sp.]